MTYDCSGHTQHYCDGYSQGFNTYKNNSEQQTQTQAAEINVKGNDNYVVSTRNSLLALGAILHSRTITTGMHMVAIFNQARQILVAK